MSESHLEKREWVYLQRPAVYEIAGCPCGNSDLDWSEYKGRLWCKVCQVDFIPAHNGIFDGPIPVEVATLMGIDVIHRFHLKTQTVESFNDPEDSK